MDEPIYVIVNGPKVVGNSVLFWANGKCGYTTDLDKAHLFTFKEAKSICESRPEQDSYFHFDSLVLISKRHVDIQALKDLK